MKSAKENKSCGLLDLSTFIPEHASIAFLRHLYGQDPKLEI